jgi:Mn-dependent DtxR family transcriptional regulator
MSESEDMYLLTVAKLVEAGAQAPIPVSRLAQELSIQPISANQMIRKLEEAGWLRYTPYKGVELTQEGEGLALRTLRHRRLWEVFLVENLQLSLDEADEMACRLEHILPAEVAERLAGFLGYPATSPRGKPIPDLAAAINLPGRCGLEPMNRAAQPGYSGRCGCCCLAFLSGIIAWRLSPCWGPATRVRFLWMSRASGSPGEVREKTG